MGMLCVETYTDNAKGVLNGVPILHGIHRKMGDTVSKDQAIELLGEKKKSLLVSLLCGFH